MNKKGLFFTFITVMLLTVLLIAFLAKTGNTASSAIQQSQSKIKSLNAFVKNFDDISERALQASSKQVIVSSQNYSFENQVYMDNFQADFPRLIIEGKYNGELLQRMDEFNITNTLLIIKAAALETNINLTYDEVTPLDISIQHTSPWEIEVILNLNNVRIRDIEEEVVWNIPQKTIKTVLFVKDFNDPLTIKNEQQSLKIVQTPTVEFGDFDSLNNFILRHEFFARGYGPSFLQRMAGDFSDSQNGIESIMPKDNPDSPNPSAESYIDYYYFGSRSDEGSCEIPGFPANFKLDSPNKNFYTGSPC